MYSENGNSKQSSQTLIPPLSLLAQSLGTVNNWHLCQDQVDPILESSPEPVDPLGSDKWQILSLDG